MSLRQEVKEELARIKASKQITNLVLAALSGQDEIERVLAGEAVEESEVAPDITERASPVYLQDITVAGFRGIGPEATLEIPPGPGLTVVVGRNGSGKSSFSEALEVLLTGNSNRWEKKTLVWKKGWRNLHQGDSPKIVARFQVEEMNRQTVIERTWNHDQKMEDVKCKAQHHGQKLTDLTGIGWAEPLELYRPILSYNELSMIANKPSVFYDVLAKGLGLDNLPDALQRLADARLAKKKKDEKVTQSLKNHIIPKLNELEDERATIVKKSLKKYNWDLETVKTTIKGGEFDASDEHLRYLINIPAPDKEQVIKVANKLKEAYTNFSSMSGTKPEQSEHLIVLLTKALEHYQAHQNQPCPVCEVGMLDHLWFTRVTEQMQDLQGSALRYQKVDKELKSALDEARRMVITPKLPESSIVEIENLISAWNQWSLLPENTENISGHLISQYSVVMRELDIVSKQARKIFFDREDKWRSIIPELSAWVCEAEKVIEGRRKVAIIEQAEKKIKAVITNLRNRRWLPIEKQALDLWKDLRLESNVNLLSVQLAGARTTRKVNLKVDVDSISTNALSVVSQGELSCLALSLFFPRAMMTDSPFRFLVIDDPIQAMDPARVDGLARVFDKIAKERQLIVFTHDDRLPRSLRLLNLEHSCLEVIRLPDSVVKISEKSDPVIQYFKDARSVMKDDDFPEKMARKVIPGFCRSGLEAACMEAIWRKKLARGKAHQAIEEELSDANKLSQKASLLFFDKIRQGDKVYEKIYSMWRKRSLADAYRDANKGSHRKYPGKLSDLINDCQSLAERLRRYNV